jgi:hypothetical protein
LERDLPWVCDIEVKERRNVISAGASVAQI